MFNFEPIKKERNSKDTFYGISVKKDKSVYFSHQFIKVHPEFTGRNKYTVEQDVANNVIKVVIDPSGDHAGVSTKGSLVITTTRANMTALSGRYKLILNDPEKEFIFRLIQ